MNEKTPEESDLEKGWLVVPKPGSKVARRWGCGCPQGEPLTPAEAIGIGRCLIHKTKKSIKLKVGSFWLVRDENGAVVKIVPYTGKAQSAEWVEQGLTATQIWLKVAAAFPIEEMMLLQGV